MTFTKNPSTAFGGPPPFNKGGMRAVEGASPYGDREGLRAEGKINKKLTF